MASTVASTLNAQLLVDYARTFPWTTPVMGRAGYTTQPAVSFLDEVVKKILAKTNPWKWNANGFPAINLSPYQQDYPTSVSQNVLGWLQAAVALDINNTSNPRPKIPVIAVDRLLPTMTIGRPQKVCWITNSIAITGVWGRGEPSDPGPNDTYTNPIVIQKGGPGNNPLTAITDANGNILVVTTYGTTGSVPPLATLNAPAGTTVSDGSVVWTVQDPNGVALRVDAMPTNQSMVWQLKVLYQQKPPNIKTLTQTIAPIPDDLDYLVKQGFLAFCTKQTDRAKFPAEYAQWLEDIQSAMGSSDREYQEFGFYPSAAIQGGGDSGSTGAYGYPGWPGWQ
ncbi:MAG: hypothetical protein ACYC7B_04440 [Burkholderiales bacterium]